VADQLCAPEDLASLLEQDLDAYKANMLVECATAIVQATCGQPPQRLVEVEGDAFELVGLPGAWLDLPQRPVTAVTSVELDGEALTIDDDYKVFGSRLWRSCGWVTTWGQPTRVTGVYDHGYPDGHQSLQLARSAVLSLIKGVYGNPAGVVRVAIDDYSEAYEKLAAQMDASPFLAAALRRQYGSGAGLLRVS
jgi:hypothetical protein